MRVSSIAIILLVVSVALFPLSSCEKKQDSLIIAASSNLQYPVRDLADTVEKESNQKIDVVLGSSGKLTAQIINGAPYDIFLSADRKYSEELEKQGFTVGEITTYSYGRLELIYQKGGGSNIEDIISQSDRVSIANPEIAPYGRASREALRNMGLWEELTPRLVYGENISQATQLLMGGASCAITATSLAQHPELDKFERIPIPEELHSPIDQTMVIIRSDNPQEDLISRFTSIITGAKGKSILQDYGYRLPE